MAIAYTKKNDIRLNSSFTITNTEGSANITISVATPPDQVSKIILYTDYVLVTGQSLEIKPKVVCRYLVTIKKPSTNETALEYFTYIDDVTEYFIKDSLEFLCGDDCEDCKEKTTLAEWLRVEKKLDIPKDSDLENIEFYASNKEKARK